MARKRRRASDRPPWEQMAGAVPWGEITGAGPTQDHLLLVWRDRVDRNRTFMVPRQRVPEAWLPDIGALDGMYLDLEAEDGNRDDLARLLALVYCAVNTVTRLNTIWYGGIAWPVGAVTGRWAMCHVPPGRVVKSRVGLVVCAGAAAPPEETS